MRSVADVEEVFKLIESYKERNPGIRVPLAELLRENDLTPNLVDLTFNVAPPKTPWTVTTSRPLKRISLSATENEMFENLGGDLSSTNNLTADWVWDTLSSPMYKQLVDVQKIDAIEAKRRVENLQQTLVTSFAERELTTEITVPRRSALLRNIDFNDVKVDGCDFSECDLSGSVFSGVVEKVNFSKAVLDGSTLKDLSFKDCELVSTSFDYCQLSKIAFKGSQLDKTHFNFLVDSSDIVFEIEDSKQFKDVVILGGSPDSVSLVNTGKEDALLIKDFTSTHQATLNRVQCEQVKDRPKVLLPWINHSPDICATLTQKELMREDLGVTATLNVITMDSHPAGLDVIALDAEIDALHERAMTKIGEMQKEIQSSIDERSDSSFLSDKELERLDDLGFTTDNPLSDPVSKWITCTPEESPAYSKLAAGYGFDGAKARVISSRKRFKEEILGKVRDRRDAEFSKRWGEKKESLPMQMMFEMRENQKAYPQAARVYENALSAYNACDSVVISGGAGMDPRFYRQEKSARKKPITSQGDAQTEFDYQQGMFEFSLIYIQQRAAQPKPLHAISRGSQAVAVAYGGTLIPEIETERDAFVMEYGLLTPPATPVDEDRPSSSLSLDALHQSDDEVIRSLFFEHQGFRLGASAHGVVPVGETLTKSGEEMFLAAENLPQNIGIIQADLDSYGSQGIAKTLSAELTKHFFSNVAVMATQFASSERAGIRDMRAYISGNKVVFNEGLKPISIKDMQEFSRPADEVRSEKTDYDTVIVGLGPVGLASAIAAIERGERVALVTDRDPKTGLGVRQQVLGVDEVMEWVAEDLVRPDLLQKFLRNNRVHRVMYQARNPVTQDPIGEPKPYWGFSTGSLEELLVEEMELRIQEKQKEEVIDLLVKSDQFFDEAEIKRIVVALAEEVGFKGLSAENQSRIARHVYLQEHRDEKTQLIEDIEAVARGNIGIDVIKIGKIPPGLSRDIDLSRGMHCSSQPDSLVRPSLQQHISKLKKLRTHMNIEGKTISLGSVEEINGVRVEKGSRHSLGFHDLVAANGGKQQTEKAMSGTITGEDVHLSKPLYDSHVAAVFQLGAETSWAPESNHAESVALSARGIQEMLDYCKAHPEVPIKGKMSELRKFGWDQGSRPHQQVYVTGADRIGEKDYLYIGCEYPDILKPTNLLELIKLAIEAYNIDPSQLTASDAIPEAIKVALLRIIDESTIAGLSKLLVEPISRNRDLSDLSKSLIRDWCRVIIPDALPKEVCTTGNLLDPVYDTEKPINRGKKALATSTFDLGFFELGQSLTMLGDETSGYGAMVSLGDGRMFPLYTTGTGAQTGLKLARLFDEAKREYNEGIKELKQKGRVVRTTIVEELPREWRWSDYIPLYHAAEETHTVERVEEKRVPFEILFKTEDPSQLGNADREAYDLELQDYQEAELRLSELVYSKYHASSRGEIDGIREVQATWIKDRNNRFTEAKKVFETLTEALGLHEKVNVVVKSCGDLLQACSLKKPMTESPDRRSPGAILFSTLQDNGLSKELAGKIASSMSEIQECMDGVSKTIYETYTKYTDDEVVAYEQVPQLALKETGAVSSHEYYEKLSQTCGEIHQLSELATNTERLVNDHIESLVSDSSPEQKTLLDILQAVKKTTTSMYDLLECSLFQKHIQTPGVLEDDDMEQVASVHPSQPV